MSNMMSQRMFYPENIYMGFEPQTFSLDDLREDIVQNSLLLNLEDRVLDHIISFIPLKERLNTISKVCKKLKDSSYRSIKSIAFFRDQIDYCDDAIIANFLSKFGQQINYLNFDLFRSSGLNECSQWSWRQSVIQAVGRCTNLKHLDVLVCSRHRLRDGDLNVIFKNCVHLETLKMDSQYIIGHSFVKSPTSLRRLEMEQCSRFCKYFFLAMCARLKKLCVLHVSQLKCLDEKGFITKMTDTLKNLRQLSIVGDPEYQYKSCPIIDVRKLTKLEILCLEGLNIVTDKFLSDFCDNESSPASKSLHSISLAYCQNISNAGISKLSNLKKLKNINLDGVSKRDISTSIDTIAQNNLLERLLISDGTFICADSVLNCIQLCPQLRLLDISNNANCCNSLLANSLLCMHKSGLKLTVLTDDSTIWTLPNSSKDSVQIVDIYRNASVLPVTSSISVDGPLQLPDGLLIPDLRRGNLFRMINNAMCAEPMIADEQENQFWSEIMNDFAKSLNDSQLNVANIPLPLSEPLPTEILKENDVFNLYGSIASNPPINESLLRMMTVGSAGAPQPPSQNENASPGVQPKYKRSHRSRRTAKEKVDSPPPPRAPVPQFNEEDFPPLS